MKLFLTTIVLAVTVTSVATAQGFAAGIKLGTNVNKIQGQSFSDKFTYGYCAGAFAEVRLNNKFGIQPEVVFNQINTDTSSSFSQLYKLSPATISNIKLTYLSIPLLLNYKLSKGIAIQGGPQFGLLIDQTKNLLQNGENAFKKGDLNMLAGITVKISSIRLYGRYAIGLNNINDIDNKDKWKNQSIQLGVGFAIL